MVDNNEILGQILQLGQTLNTFQVQTNATLNELRTEIKKSREIENEHWLENLRRWEENDKRWEENNRRWDENDKRWEENNRRWDENDKRWEENNRRWDENDKRWEENKRRWDENDKRWEENKKLWKENNEKWKENKKMWIQNEINRENEHQEIMDTFIRYDISVSKKLGDPNADKMKKFLKCN